MQWPIDAADCQADRIWYSVVHASNCRGTLAMIPAHDPCDGFSPTPIGLTIYW
jgi:hypothetical protein